MKTPSTRPLQAAVLSAALATPLGALADEYTLIPGPVFDWNSPDTAKPSLSRINIWSGITLPTFASEATSTDPWDELSDLEENWDGNGAQAISPEAVAYARRFLTLLPCPPEHFEPFAHPNGHVGLEGHKNGKSAYLIASADNTFTYVIKAANTIHRGTNVEAAEMHSLLEMLY